MEELVFDSKNVTASYLTDERLLHLNWKEETNSGEYRKLFQTLVEFAKNSKVRFILSDMRKEGLISIEDVKWLEKEIFGEAISKGIEKIALVSSDNIFTNVYAETVKRKLKDSPIKVQLFDNLESAKAWLTTE